MTNFERIKNMSIDEMAKIIAKGTGLRCCDCCIRKGAAACYSEDCVANIKQYLESEAEKNDG